MDTKREQLIVEYDRLIVDRRAHCPGSQFKRLNEAERTFARRLQYWMSETPNHDRFTHVRFYGILHQCSSNRDHINIDSISLGFYAVERFALNLLDSPWLPEYRIVRVSLNFKSKIILKIKKSVFLDVFMALEAANIAQF